MPEPFKLAREAFPSGLIQPPGSFRFSVDALLLASFVLRHGLPPDREIPASLLDLGCGCGVVALACLLGRDTLSARGADREPELLAAARENAALLGVADRFSAVLLDVTDARARAGLTARRAGRSVDAVCANMPYRREGAGRVPRSLLRRRALFADKTTLPSFVAAAKAALGPEGRFSLIYPWDAREALFAALREHGFFPETTLPVETLPGKKMFCLVCARPRPAPERLLPPLCLRAEKGGAYTAEALSFCPWL